jgi:omega-6 fatty acid desaturase (delta-12 desaturase)
VAAKNVLALRQPLAALRAQSGLWAATLSISAAAAYVAAFLGAAFLEPLWLRVTLSLALAPLIAMLFRIAHDCGHECHFAGRRLNRIVGRLSNLAPYHPYSLWILFHNWRHHTFTNLRERDYIWIPLSKGEYDRLPRHRQLIERLYRTNLGVGAYYLCAIWFGTMIWPRRANAGRIKAIHVWDSLAVLAFFAGQITVLSIGAESIGAFTLRVLLCIVVPFALFCWMVGFVSFLNHTHPDVPWFSRREEWSFYTGQVNCTVHMGVPKWMIFFLTDIGLHGAHHIDPRIPIWGLDRAEPRLVAAAHHDMIVERWSWRRHRDILRRCKLYDYDTHRWLDFAGRPTGPALFVKPA